MEDTRAIKVESVTDGAVSSEPGPARVSEWGASDRESALTGDTRDYA
jgi:hypothetical protein